MAETGLRRNRSGDLLLTVADEEVVYIDETRFLITVEDGVLKIQESEGGDFVTVADQDIGD